MFVRRGVDLQPLILFEFKILSQESNMQRRIEAEKLTIMPKTTPAADFGWLNYFHLDTINAWLNVMADTYEFVSLVTLDGSSYEGLPIVGVKIAQRQGNPTIFVEGGIHAREWISPAVLTYILNQLLTSKGTSFVVSTSATF